MTNSTRCILLWRARPAAAAILAALCGLGGSARGQAFEPVQPIAAGADRAALAAEAAEASRDGNVYGDVQAGAVSPQRTSGRDRAAVRAEAVAAAHDPSQNLDRRAFVNSEIPPQFRPVPGTPCTGR